MRHWKLKVAHSKLRVTHLNAAARRREARVSRSKVGSAAFELSLVVRESSDATDQALSGSFQASGGVFEAFRVALQASSAAVEASDEALGTGCRAPNINATHRLRHPPLTPASRTSSSFSRPFCLTTSSPEGLRQARAVPRNVPHRGSRAGLQRPGGWCPLRHPRRVSYGKTCTRPPRHRSRTPALRQRLTLNRQPSDAYSRGIEDRIAHSGSDRGKWWLS